jgi:hypothetical protein
MHVNNVREVPEYEIDPLELDFSNGSDLSKVCIYTTPFLSHEHFANWMPLVLISIH